MTRRLIVNADDFGQSAGINRGVAACHAAGIVRSASLMVRWPDAVAAAAYAREHPSLGVGLHIDLCEWTCPDGRWRPAYEVVALHDETAVGREVMRQIEAFVGLIGGPPTHLDSHQHVHREPAVLRAAQEAAVRFGIPLRGYDARVRYDGRFYGQGRGAQPCHELISREHLSAIIEALPDGITELSCHPALGIDVDSAYRTERELETAVLCDPRTRAMVDATGVELTSFREAIGVHD